MPKHDRPGRPSKLTEDTKTALLNAIKAGLTYDLACGAAGISFQTFRNWQERGEAAKSGEYFEFLEDLKEAEGQGGQRLITLINRSANEGQWAAAAWILERRYPENFARKPPQAVELSGKDGGPIKQKVEHTDSTERQERFNDLFGQLDAYRVGYDDRDREGDPGESIHTDHANGQAT